MSKKKPDTSNERTIENRKARFDYHILEELECGIMLRGSEVKSVRAGSVSLAEGWVKPEGGTLHLYGVNIGEYGPSGPLGGAGQHKPTRARTLLAHKAEILKLTKKIDEKGLTIVPLKMYFKNGYAKVLIGVAKGKAAHDKRHAIAKRETDREIRRAMSRRQ